MKKITITTLFLLFVSMLLAGPRYEATYRLISKSYTLNDDGSSDIRIRKELQLHTISSFDVYGETLIPYNSDFQSLTINEAYTIRKDGSKVNTPDNAFNPSLPSGCTDCERLSHIREMVVTHTALEIDAIIVLDYTLHANNFFMPEIMETIALHEQVPIDRYEVSLNIPRGVSVFYDLCNNGQNTQAMQVDESNPGHIHWIFTHLEATPNDAYLVQGQLPSLTFNTVENPATFIGNMVSQHAFQMANLTPLKSVVEQLTADKSSDMEKIIALRNYVYDNIHTNSIALSLLNYVVAAPATVWQTNCGNILEKNLLLQAMLSLANIPATLGMLYDGSSLTDASLLRIMQGNQYYYFSAGSKSSLSLDVFNAGKTFVPFSGEESVTFQARPTNVNINANMRVALANGTPSVEVQMQKNDIQSSQAATLMPTTLRASSARVTRLGNGYYQMSVDNSAYGSSIQSAYLYQRRTLPVAVPVTSEQYVYQITLPAGAQWISKPYRIERQYDQGSIVVDVAVDGQVLTLTRRLEIKDSVVSVKQYKSFRAMMAEWNAERRLTFKSR